MWYYKNKFKAIGRQIKLQVKFGTYKTWCNCKASLNIIDSAWLAMACVPLGKPTWEGQVGLRVANTRLFPVIWCEQPKLIIQRREWYVSLFLATEELLAMLENNFNRCCHCSVESGTPVRPPSIRPGEELLRVVPLTAFAIAVLWSPRLPTYFPPRPLCEPRPVWVMSCPQVFSIPPFGISNEFKAMLLIMPSLMVVSTSERIILGSRATTLEWMGSRWTLNSKPSSFQFAFSRMNKGKVSFFCDGFREHHI